MSKKGSPGRTGVVEEERVVRLSPVHQPGHCAQDILPRGLTPRIPLVVGKDDHILPPEALLLHQEIREIPNIVDTALQLALLPEIVDANQERLSLPSAVRVLVGVVRWRTVSELLHSRRRRWRRTYIHRAPVSLRL